MDEFTRATREAEKELEIKRGKIFWIFRQYARKALDFQRPCTQTISGLVPRRSNSVQPPILKPWPLRDGRPAAVQIVLHLCNQFDFVSASQPPSSVSKAKRGAPAGTLALADKWWRSAGMGEVGSSRSVRTIVAPLGPSVLDHGMWKLAWRTPDGVVPKIDASGIGNVLGWIKEVTTGYTKLGRSK